MPLFEYRCEKCGHVMEVLESAAGGGKHKCEKCGSTNTKKVFSSFAARMGGVSTSGSSSCPTGTCPLS